MGIRFGHMTKAWKMRHPSSKGSSLHEFQRVFSSRAPKVLLFTSSKGSSLHEFQRVFSLRIPKGLLFTCVCVIASLARGLLYENVYPAGRTVLVYVDLSPARGSNGVCTSALCLCYVALQLDTNKGEYLHKWPVGACANASPPLIFCS